MSKKKRTDKERSTEMRGAVRVSIEVGIRGCVGATRKGRESIEGGALGWLARGRQACLRISWLH